jgi:hypothetical protein
MTIAAVFAVIVAYAAAGFATERVYAMWLAGVWQSLMRTSPTFRDAFHAGAGVAAYADDLPEPHRSRQRLVRRVTWPACALAIVVVTIGLHFAVRATETSHNARNRKERS